MTVAVPEELKVTRTVKSERPAERLSANTAAIPINQSAYEASGILAAAGNSDAGGSHRVASVWPTLHKLALEVHDRPT